MKILSKIISALTTIALLVCMLVAVTAYFKGVKCFSILSGSMKGTYEVGDMIFVLPVPYEEISVGDPITYVFDSNLTVVTHRVVEKYDDEQRLLTKGDANNTPDAKTVMYQNVVGKVVWSVPKLGFVARAMSTTAGKLFLVSCIILIAILSILLEPVFAKLKAKLRPAITESGETIEKKDKA